MGEAKMKRRQEIKANHDAERLAKQNHPEEIVEGRRKISKQIMGNRGLVKQRKKTSGNARVANRRRSTKATSRRRGAVQDHREGAPDGTYTGEGSGIRSHLSKAMRF